MLRSRFLSLSACVAVAGAALMSPSPVSASDRRGFSARLEGFSEVPAISSTGKGFFRARLSLDGLSLHYRLSFSGLSAPVTQAHIHFGEKHTAGSIMVWLCQSPPTTVDPTGLAPLCVDEGTVEGDLTTLNIVQAGSQGIVAGEFEEFVRALRNDAGYANVHTTAFPVGEIRGQVR